MIKIKFGTDGWRAIIGDEYTLDNVKRVAAATADWLNQKYDSPSVVVGYDCRFGGDLFSKIAARVLANEGVKVYLSDNFASTPMVSLGAVQHNASAGVVITASHNPPMYNGYKLKGGYGGPMTPSMVSEVEDLIEDVYEEELDSLEDFIESGSIEYTDLEEMYIEHCKKNFDLETIKQSGVRLGFDAMYGAGQNVIPRLLPNSVLLHCEYNPGFQGQAPEPIEKNLEEFSKLIANNDAIDMGLAVDGDADRLGLFNAKGAFVDSHHIILMLLNYLHGEKGITGKVATSFSVSNKVAKFCKEKGLEHIITKIGFKYICEYMIEDDILVGGEESGGIAVKGHIPERDGIWIGLTLLEYMAVTGKTLDDLINEVYAIVGRFAFERDDLHISEIQKQQIVQNCADNAYTDFGRYKIKHIDALDGYKFFFEDDSWVMIRPSGTEPVLRVYAEAATREEAKDIIRATKETILA